MIEVNHQALRNLADAIDTYCDEQDKEMTRADASVKSMLSSEWIGLDAMDFGGKWEGVDAPESVTVQFRESLKKYAETLRTSASIYQKAQEDIYNKAALLPKW